MIEINSNWNMAARSSASTSRIAVSVSAIVERVISTECRHSVAVDRIATMVARGPSTSWPDPCSTVLSAPSRTTMGPAIGGNDLTIRRKWEGFVYDLRKRLAEEALRLRLADRAEPRWEAQGKRSRSVWIGPGLVYDGNDKICSIIRLDQSGSGYSGKQLFS